jgi:hypothetical protein
MPSETTSHSASPLRPGTFLTRDAATKVLVDAGIPLSASSLDHMANRGTGPRFQIRNGRAIYARADLEAWIAANADSSELHRLIYRLADLGLSEAEMSAIAGVSVNDVRRALAERSAASEPR